MSLIDVQNLTFAYDGSYENIFENVSFQIDTDWRLGFVGRNGRGKTTFLRLLLGQYPYQGKISASVDFAYFPYPVEEPERTVAEVAERLSPGGETWELERELAGLELDGAGRSWTAPMGASPTGSGPRCSWPSSSWGRTASSSSTSPPITWTSMAGRC